MSRIYIVLGRAGDILNILPLMLVEYQAGRSSRLMVAKEFAGILEGVKYVDPIIFDGAPHEIDRAVELARTMFKDVMCLQVAGPPEMIKQHTYDPAGQPHAKTESFQKEMWQLAGKLELWRDQPPLVFDNRNAEREKSLLSLKQFGYSNRDWILVAVDGHSSPFPYKKLLIKLLELFFHRRVSFQIIDLSEIKAERLFDLLAVLTHRKARMLFASDSAILHLAYAVPTLPVIALTQDKPSLWHGAAWRPNHIFHCRYSDWMNRADEMLERIDVLSKDGCVFNPKLASPRIIHTWSQYEVNDENRGRHESAKLTWEPAYRLPLKSPRWISTPLEIGAVGRDSTVIWKDHLRFPFVKDAIRNACLRASEDDVIVISRCDTCFSVDITERILNEQLPIFCRRPASNNVDLFAFTKKWWRDNQADYPDMSLGLDPHWHRVLAELMRLTGGREVKDLIYREPGTVVPINITAYRENNERLMKDWMHLKGISTNYPKVSSQAKTTVINPNAIYKFGYNPSIIRHDGKILLAYRAHPVLTDAQTKIGIAELDEDLNVRSNQLLDIPGKSVEDPRLFCGEKYLYLSWVESTWPEQPPKSVVKFGMLKSLEGKWGTSLESQPNYGRNDFSTMEKNWVFFIHEEKGMCLYASQPEQIVISIWGEKITEFKSKSPTWAWGDIRGGCIVPYKDKLLRFFHSRLENEPAPIRWRYYVGCLLMESTPPFKVLKVCKEPIIRGSEDDDLGEQRQACPHWKSNVIFPTTCILQGDDFLLSVGINDAESAVVRLKEEDLKL
jgi:predicted GH43/DUF377 family glycosyl hydrolase